MWGVCGAWRGTGGRAARLPPRVPFRRCRQSLPGGIGAPVEGQWIVPGPRNFWVLGQASKAPSMATGRIHAFEHRPGKHSKARAKRRNFTITATHMPSGKISTISPRFKRRSDSLMPLSPRPSRSMGIASRVLISQRIGAKRNKVLPGQDSSSAACNRDQERIEVALVVRDNQHRSGGRYILAAIVADTIGQHACKVDQPAEELIPKAIQQRTLGHWASFAG